MRPFLSGLLGGLVAIVVVAGVALVAVPRLRAGGVAATATPDARSALLADLADLDRAGEEPYSALALGCLTLARTNDPATAAYNRRNYDATQVFLRQHPALDRYATWFSRQGNGLAPVCAGNMRDQGAIDRYLATR